MMAIDDQKSSDINLNVRDSCVLDATFNAARWRTEVTQTLIDLEERIIRLEKRGSTFLRQSSLITRKSE